jgi:hypothetical protein
MLVDDRLLSQQRIDLDVPVRLPAVVRDLLRLNYVELDRHTFLDDRLHFIDVLEGMLSVPAP